MAGSCGLISGPPASAITQNVMAPPSHLFAHEDRTLCEVWTRVMGYHRPVSDWNMGKQAEHAERKHYREN